MPEREQNPPVGAIAEFLKQGLAPRDVARILGAEIMYVEVVAQSRLQLRQSAVGLMCSEGPSGLSNHQPLRRQVNSVG
jgi:hypothetical protein